MSDVTTTTTLSSPMNNSLRKRIAVFFSILGPGLVVMLADTDAGSIITAAQSGAVWGYKLLSLQIILIPIVFIAQELTVRLGLATGMGHGELIKKHFGVRWAWFSIGTLLIGCVGAIITELSGIAGVGTLFGIPSWITSSATVLFLITIAWTGTYRSVELVALLIGSFELVFIIVAWYTHPSWVEITEGIKSTPWNNTHFLYLAAANIGAVVMPWMIFYQQSAILDKGLSTKHLSIARWDTAIGAVITQLIMMSVLIATAATIGKTNPGAPLDTIHQISDALIPTLGPGLGKILFALGIIGASIVAAIVVSLTAAWGLGEIMGFRRSLQDHPKDAPWFYGIYSTVLIIGSVVVSSGINLVNLSIAVEVMNALLLPIVLGFLYLLACRTLPEQYRLKSWYGLFVGVVLFITSVFGLGAGVIGSFS